MSILILNGEAVLAPALEDGGVYLSQIAKVENSITVFLPIPLVEDEDDPLP